MARWQYCGDCHHTFQIPGAGAGYVRCPGCGMPVYAGTTPERVVTALLGEHADYWSGGLVVTLPRSYFYSLMLRRRYALTLSTEGAPHD